MITKEQADIQDYKVVRYSKSSRSRKNSVESGFKVTKIFGHIGQVRLELKATLPPFFTLNGTVFKTKKEAIEYLQIYIYL